MKTTTKISMAIMFLGMMFMSLSGVAQDKQKTSATYCPMSTDKNSDTATMECPMAKTMTKEEVKQMVSNCHMMKGMSDKEKEKMMSKCPLMKLVEKAHSQESRQKE